MTDPLRTPKRQRVIVNEEDEVTPRPALLLPSRPQNNQWRSTPPATINSSFAGPVTAENSPSVSSASTTSLGTDASSSRKGRTSPTKARRVAWSLESHVVIREMTTLPNTDNDTQTLIRRLGEIARMQGIVPRDVSNDFRARARSDLVFGDGCLSTETFPMLSLREMNTLLGQAVYADQSGMSEAHWNSAVHHPLLNMTLGGTTYVDLQRCVNISSATLDKKFIATSTEYKIEMKQVDFANVIQLTSQQRQRLRDTLRDGQLLNHSDHGGLLDQPLAFSIETKTTGGNIQEAVNQLATWNLFGKLKMRQLIQGLPVDLAAGLGNLPFETPLEFPLIPSVLVHGHKWSLYMTQIGDEQPDIMWHVVDFGSTASWLGICQIVCALLALFEYTEKVLRPWWTEVVLAQYITQR